MHEDDHDVHIDVQHPAFMGLVAKQDVLDAEQGNEDECGPHSSHVEAGLCLVRPSQLSDENPDDVQ